MTLSLQSLISSINIVLYFLFIIIIEIKILNSHYVSDLPEPPTHSPTSTVDEKRTKLAQSVAH